MKRIILSIGGALALALIFLTCAQQPQPIIEEVANIDGDVAAIHALTEAWGVAVEADDVAALIALRTDDVVQMPPDAPASRGKQALEDFYRGLFEHFSVEGTWPVEGTEEIVVADGWAFHLSEYILRTRPKAGGEATEERGKIIIICRQQPDGTWKFAREIWNRNNPPPGME
jgi:ketosteroid isomerase-like protein